MMSNREAAARIPHAKIWLKRQGESDKQAIKASAPSFSTLTSISSAVRDLFPELSKHDKISFATETKGNPAATSNVNLGFIPSSTLVGCLEGQTLIVVVVTAAPHPEQGHVAESPATKNKTPRNSTVPTTTTTSNNNNNNNSFIRHHQHVQYFTPTPQGASASRLLSQRKGVDNERPPSPNRSFVVKKQQQQQQVEKPSATSASPFQRTSNQHSSTIASPTPNVINNNSAQQRLQYYHETRKQIEDRLRDKKLKMKKLEEEAEHERNLFTDQLPPSSSSPFAQLGSWGAAAVEIPSFPSASQQRLTSVESSQLASPPPKHQNRHHQDAESLLKDTWNSLIADGSTTNNNNNNNNDNSNRNHNHNNNNISISKLIQETSLSSSSPPRLFSPLHRRRHHSTSPSSRQQFSSSVEKSFMMALSMLVENAKKEFDDFLFLTVARTLQPGATEKVRQAVRSEMHKLEVAIRLASSALRHEQQQLQEDDDEERRRNNTTWNNNKNNNNNNSSSPSRLNTKNVSGFVNPFEVVPARHNQNAASSPPLLPPPPPLVDSSCELAYWNLSDALANFRQAAMNAYGDDVFVASPAAKRAALHDQSQGTSFSSRAHNDDGDANFSFTSYTIGRKSILSQEDRNRELLKREFLVLLAELTERPSATAQHFVTADKVEAQHDQVAENNSERENSGRLSLRRRLDRQLLTLSEREASIRQQLEQQHDSDDSHVREQFASESKALADALLQRQEQQRREEQHELVAAVVSQEAQQRSAIDEQQEHARSQAAKLRDASMTLVSEEAACRDRCLQAEIREFAELTGATDRQLQRLSLQHQESLRRAAAESDEARASHSVAEEFAFGAAAAVVRAQERGDEQRASRHRDELSSVDEEEARERASLESEHDGDRHRLASTRANDRDRVIVEAEQEPQQRAPLEVDEEATERNQLRMSVEKELTERRQRDVREQDRDGFVEIESQCRINIENEADIELAELMIAFERETNETADDDAREKSRHREQLEHLERQERHVIVSNEGSVIDAASALFGSATSVFSEELFILEANELVEREQALQSRLHQHDLLVRQCEAELLAKQQHFDEQNECLRQESRERDQNLQHQEDSERQNLRQMFDDFCRRCLEQEKVEQEETEKKETLEVGESKQVALDEGEKEKKQRQEDDDDIDLTLSDSRGQSGIEPSASASAKLENYFAEW